MINKNELKSSNSLLILATKSKVIDSLFVIFFSLVCVYLKCKI